MVIWLQVSSKENFFVFFVGNIGRKFKERFEKCIVGIDSTGNIFGI